MASISTGGPGAAGFCLRGMFGAHMKRARGGDNKRENDIVGRERQAEQAPGHGAAADLGLRRTRTHDIGMCDTAGRKREDAMLYARLIGTDQARDDDQYNSRPGQRAGVSAQEWNKCKADNGCRDTAPNVLWT